MGRRILDLTGQTFGDLLVIKILGSKSGSVYCLCRCLLCGAEIEIQKGHLKTQVSCRDCANKNKRIERISKRYGRLVVISLHQTKSREAHWYCQCDCGGTTTVRGSSLSRGDVKSCGCLRSELTIERHLTHGMTGIPEYITWASMIARTTDKSKPNSKNYIDRGITVCDSWLHSFENFYKDMGDRLSPKHSIDRINNDGNYEPGNCRWATSTEQNNNKRSNVNITLSNETHTLKQWANIYNIDYKMVYYRYSAGWPISEIFMKTLKRKHHCLNNLKQ